MLLARPKFRPWTLSLGDLEGLCSALCGAPRHSSPAPKRTAPTTSGQSVTFPGYGSVGEWLDLIDAPPSRDPFIRAAWRHAVIVIQHPMTDGNGRLARALFQGSLIEDGIVDLPALPLTLAMHLQKDAVRRGIGGLGLNGDWVGYLEMMECVTRRALALAKAA